MKNTKFNRQKHKKSIFFKIRGGGQMPPPPNDVPDNNQQFKSFLRQIMKRKCIFKFYLALKKNDALWNVGWCLRMFNIMASFLLSRSNNLA